MYGSPAIKLAENPRTAVKASIRRASASARSSLRRIDRDALSGLTGIYERARDDIRQQILAAGDISGNLRLESLQTLLAQTEQRLRQLTVARNGLLEDRIRAAADLGIEPFIPQQAVIGSSLVIIADEAVRFTQNFIANDGLQLTDRIWRIDNHAREVIAQSIQSHVIQGHSASQAAQEFLSRGEAVTGELAAKMGMASAERVARVTGRELMHADGNPYGHALTLFRTEINRAHLEAYREAGFSHPDVIGTRVLLSPNHPRQDICDMHASVNHYGLGKGVYPKGKSPIPAHPNTLTFEEVVFSDEVTDEDKAGKENRIDWLNKQTPSTQAGVLGSTKKRAALQKGILKENQIATPWNVLKKRFERKGIDIDALTVEPLARASKNE